MRNSCTREPRSSRRTKGELLMQESLGIGGRVMQVPPSGIAWDGYGAGRDFWGEGEAKGGWGVEGGR